MVQTMQRAGNGFITLPKMEIPEVLTPVKVFELFVRNERSKIQKVAGVFAEYIRRGSMPNEMDPAFAQKMEETMGDNADIEGLEELGLEDEEHHPLAIFMMAQTKYTQLNKDGFKMALQQFMTSIQLNTQQLATGQLNPGNIDEFMAKLEHMGEDNIAQYRAKVEGTDEPAVTQEVTENAQNEENTEVQNEEVTEQTDAPAQEGDETEVTQTETETPAETQEDAQENTEETAENQDENEDQENT